MKINSCLKLKYLTIAGLSKKAQKALKKYSLTGQITLSFLNGRLHTNAVYHLSIPCKHTNIQTYNNCVVSMICL